MPNTKLEANLHDIGDGARLEELVVDLLVREGYDVDPTGVRGPDGVEMLFLNDLEDKACCIAVFGLLSRFCLNRKFRLPAGFSHPFLEEITTRWSSS